MKLRFSPPPVLAGLAVGVLLAGGVVWASGSIQSAGEQVCRTKAGYLRISTTGECRRSEVPVDLPQGPQGEQGLQGRPGANGRDGSDANVDSVRCFQRLAAGVDVHDCTLSARNVGTALDLSNADLTSAKFGGDKLSAAQLSSGERFACAVLQNSELTCWGRQYRGDSRDFVPAYWPSDLGAVSAVVTGGAFSCALKIDLQVTCWGWYWNGMRHVPMLSPPDLGNVRSLNAGTETACAVLQSGNAACWGFNAWGQADVPADLGTVRSIAAGGNHACAIRSADSAIRCWGQTSFLNMPAGVTAKHLSSTRTGTCAILLDDTVRCWANDDSGLRNVPTNLGPVTAISTADNYACAIRVDTRVLCWGSASNFAVPDDVGQVKTISVRLQNACLLTASGQISCFLDRSDAPYPQVSVQATVPDFLQLLPLASIDLSGAKLQGADLSGLRIRTMWGCAVSGRPASLPPGWIVDSGCLRRV